jgi:P-type Cu+ transporter
MTCASCAAAVEKALAKVEGVKHAAVNFASEKATLEIEGRVDMNSFITTIKGEGYGVQSNKVDLAVRGH